MLLPLFPSPRWKSAATSRQLPWDQPLRAQAGRPLAYSLLPSRAAHLIPLKRPIVPCRPGTAAHLVLQAMHCALADAPAGQQRLGRELRELDLQALGHGLVWVGAVCNSFYEATSDDSAVHVPSIRTLGAALEVSNSP